MSLTDKHDPSTGLRLQSARSALRRAQKATQESFSAYTASLETERRVSLEVAALEDRRDQLGKPHHFFAAFPALTTLSLSHASISDATTKSAPTKCALPLPRVQLHRRRPRRHDYVPTQVVNVRL